MTTTDRELLERAAKAHGFIDDQTSNDEDSHGLRRNGQGIFYVVHKRGWHNWNPLHEDGDALRLAVKLGLRVDIGWDKYTVVDWEARNDDDEPGDVEQNFDGDPYAATRRAIVRAAAAMAGEVE